jgi:predicted dehydrogenase
MDRIRWGVLGCANIADTKVIPAIRASVNGIVQAVASRDPAKARACAARHGIATAHGSYAALLADPQVDAVYLPLPTAQHAAWAERCAAAGKPVLVEKPFATSAAEAERCLAACRTSGVTAGEAYYYRFHPLHQRMAELVRTSAIGRLELLRANFTVSIPSGDFRWKPEAGGGALADIGCYCTGICRWLAGAEPVEVCARARFVDGVDATLAGILSFPGGVQATFGVSLGAQFDCSYEAFGSAGRIRVDRGGMCAWPGEAFRIQIQDAAGERFETLPDTDAYRLMVESFAASLRGGPAFPVGPEETIANLRVLDALLADARATAKASA